MSMESVRSEDGEGGRRRRKTEPEPFNLTSGLEVRSLTERKTKL